MAPRPEILAPAGDMDSLKAALASGADAVYFGLDEGFNARARAENFSLARLPETVALIHRAGARAYLTLNTLVFESELTHVEALLRGVARAGVDALIVQDPAVALLVRAVCPQLELHASTQMTLSSAEGARFAEGLGFTRMVVPRELSVAEIRRLREHTALELEVFIHGALCVSWSGQCLTSEAWGGRSANRGQCAQSCRLPYELVVDGERRELGDVQYLLSPKDLAGVWAVPELVRIGVHGLKIEGRQKGPQYVSTAVQGYRRWVDAVAQGAGAPAARQLAADLADMSLSYTRGLSSGFLGGSDHQTLVEGRFPKHRGVYLGRVGGVRGREVRVEPDPEGRPWTGGAGLGDARPSAPQGERAAPLPDEPQAAELLPRAGMGVVFDAGHPEDKHEPGGPIFRVQPDGDGWVLGFGAGDLGPELSRVKPGQRVWITSDPSLGRRTAALLEQGEPEGRLPVALSVSGREGEPLRVAARSGGFEHVVASGSALAQARAGGLDEALLREKLAAFGGTPFRLAALELAGLGERLHLPVSELKALRRELVAALTAQVERGALRTVRAEPVLDEVRAKLLPPFTPSGSFSEVPPPFTPRGCEPFGRVAPPFTPSVGPQARSRGAAPSSKSPLAYPSGGAQLLPLCRSDAQLEAVISAGLRHVELDWMELVGLERAVKRARAAGLHVTIATVRVQKPGEEGYDGRIARLAPDAVLVRHWGALMHFLEAPAEAGRPALHGDFSLNVTNSLTAGHLLSLGLSTLTCAHDLDEAQLFAMLEHAPAARFTVAVHHHIATFHTEHCVYSHLLSGGRDFKSCGRPCEKHQVSLADRVGLQHPVIVDVGCRNTVFNAQAQSAAALVPRLLERGVRRFRVEFVREDQAEASRVLSAYQALLEGRCSPAQAVEQAAVHEQFGVTRGTMQVLGSAR